ncbi:MAG: trypsin-like peptidase domain-containing protein [Lachnospiraceae bacterium]|nr:trypsin-like peptidase domain-containing protein [Lachnospiraceae bacterium]MBR6486630.1 trypsin-like peptidase domain-containing protein [Lachnospiraceae bacterium]
MYENYDFENNAIPNERERIDAEARLRRARELKEQKKEKRSKWFKCVAYALVFGLIAGGTFQGVNIAGDLLRDRLGIGIGKEASGEIDEDRDYGEREELNKARDTKDDNDKDAGEDKDEEKLNTAKAAVATPLASQGNLDVSTVAANSMPSIVSITNKSVQEVRSFFGGGIREYESVSAGSGIIVGQNDSELLIVTNNHVVEGAKELSVCFIDDEVYEAVVKGTDPDNDLAVIAVKTADVGKSTMNKISIATIGDSDALVIGEQVVAIGNALGYGQSVTTGIISALERDVEIDDIAKNLIQTDAAINPGNSGGALLNMRGEVIGINSAKLASSQIEGMGYAIPISTATPIIEELMNRQTRELVDKKDASYLGIAGVAVSDEISKTYNIPTGVYVSEVTKNGPADKAGIVKGDVIKKFDGISVSSINDVKEQLKYYKAGEKVKILVMRSNGTEYSEKTVEVTLGKKSESDIKDEDEEEEVIQEDKGNDDEGYYIDPFSIFGY